VGNELRVAEGHGVLGKLACATMAQGTKERYVVTSIRHPAEVDELRRGCQGAFCLVYLDAPARLRFNRWCLSLL
jgi:hypothetical protein